MIQKAGIIGFGALGVLYATELQKVLGYENVLVAADERRVERFRKEGVWANGVPCRFRYVTPEEAGPVDLLLFATKYQGLREAAQSAGPLCTDRTIVLSVLNGISSEQVVEDTLHPNRLLYCTVQGMDATRTGNRVTYTRTGSVALGERDGQGSEALCEAKELFERAGITCLTPPDIIHQLWSKWMLNVGVNQACAAYGVGYGGVQKEGPARRAMLAAMEEARKAAAAAGIVLSEAEEKDWVALIDTLAADAEPSMRQDVREGRSTEVGLFAGMVCSLADRYGIDVPQNREFLRILAPHLIG